MQQVELAELIPLVAGMVISLVLAYIPGVRAWWEELDGDRKRAALGVLYIATAVGMYIPSCLDWVNVVACSTASIPDVIGAAIIALIASQSAYTFLPTRTKVRMSSDSSAGDLADA